jgi:hypothetical protein
MEERNIGRAHINPIACTPPAPAYQILLRDTFNRVMDDAAMATAAGVSETTRPQLDLLMALAKYVNGKKKLKKKPHIGRWRSG